MDPVTRQKYSLLHPPPPPHTHTPHPKLGHRYIVHTPSLKTNKNLLLFLYNYTTLVACREIQVALPGYSTGAVRAALPIAISVHNVFMCPNHDRPEEQRYPLPSVCTMSSCVQTMIGLKSSATHCHQRVQCLHVSKPCYGCQCLRFLTRAQTLMQAIAQRGMYGCHKRVCAES